MNDELTEKILSEARASLDPTSADRHRMNRRIMGAIGAAAVATTATAGAAKTAGWLTTGMGIPASAVTVVKAAVGGLLFSGVIALGIVGVNAVGPDARSKSDAENATLQSVLENRESALNNSEAENVSTADEVAKSSQEESRKIARPVLVENNVSKNLTIDGQPKSLPSKKRKSEKNISVSTSALEAVPVPNDDALLQEISLIKAASRAIHSEDYSTAIRLLHEYQNRYPLGTMRQERDGLYISALCGAGQIGRAQEADSTFRHRYNKPPLMFGVDRQCSSGSKNEQLHESE